VELELQGKESGYWSVQFGGEVYMEVFNLSTLLSDH